MKEVQNQEEYRTALQENQPENGRGPGGADNPLWGQGNQPSEDENIEEEQITTLTTDATGMPVLRRVSRWERTGSRSPARSSGKRASEQHSKGERSQASPSRKMRQTGVRAARQGRSAALPPHAARGTYGRTTRRTLRPEKDATYTNASKRNKSSISKDNNGRNLLMPWRGVEGQDRHAGTSSPILHEKNRKE